MSTSFNELKIDVLDRLNQDIEDTRYERALRRAVNSVTDFLNDRPPLPRLQKTVSLDYIEPRILSQEGTLASNITFDWFGDTATWTIDSPDDWTVTDDRTKLNASNPVTVNGDPYSGQTGEALNSGVKANYIFDFGADDSIVGCYQAQTVEVLPGREYTLSSHQLQDYLENQDKFNIDGWHIMDVYPVDNTNVEYLEVNDDAVLEWVAIDPGTIEVFPSIRFKVSTPPGENPNDPVKVEIRLGWNTDGKILTKESVIPGGPPPNYAFTPEFELYSVALELTKGTTADEYVTGATLPTDLRNIVAVSLDGLEVTPLDQVTAAQRRRTKTYEREAYEIRFGSLLDPDNLPVGLLTYTPELPLIQEGVNEGDEHLGIKYFNNAYFYGALKELAAHLEDFEASGIYRQEYNDAIAQLTAGEDDWQYQSDVPIQVLR